MRSARQSFSSQLIFIPLPLSPDFEPTLKQQLQTTLGTAYQVSIQPTADASKRAIPIPTPFFDPRDATGLRLFDISVGFPDGDSAVFRIGHLPRGAPLSRNLFFNLALLVVLLVIALYVTARSITRPLSKLVSAAEGLGRNVRQPKLEEKGARELRDAARAFNTMQDGCSAISIVVRGCSRRCHTISRLRLPAYGCRWRRRWMILRSRRASARSSMRWRAWSAAR